ncbi:putative membrane protein [Microbacterium sp. AK009]|uniref:TMEM175 family protein n=1 Tax=Microbacterium sp. AK009 TaxID=2723068 RepID=UPI00184820A2|nr:TMEM175 family protein [Microbacterium sp. AK009]NYF15611.1 putative membrane protein [Microbacterium sp. AK009]
MRAKTHPEATVGATRLAAFTDGVFAIAATLLVLNLTTHTFGTIRSDGEMWGALAAMGPQFFNFALSFLLLCLLWMTHVAQFEWIVRVDGVMIWLNNIRLLFIVVVPFATGLTTEYSQYTAGRVLMPITFFLAILTSWLQWSWAVRRRADIIPDLSEGDARAYGRGALSAVIISVVVVIVSPWIGSAAFLLFVFDGLLTRLLRGR